MALLSRLALLSASRLALSAALSTAPTPLRALTAKVADLNSALTNPERAAGALPFVVDDVPLGLVLPEVADALAAHCGAAFVVSPDRVGLTAAVEGRDPAGRTEAVNAALLELREAGLVKGWRDENYRCCASFDTPPALDVERSVASNLGVRAYGVHVNGYVPATGKIWVARRSPQKPTYPGMLDNVVAGGLTAGLLPSACVVKECFEEAGVPEALALEARPAGVLSYCQYTADGGGGGGKLPGVKQDTLFVYDLPLPEDFVPVPVDGEVEGFQTMTFDEVAHSIASSDEWKPNCAGVVVDFLVRRGHLSPDEAGYCGLLTELRRAAV